MREILLPYSCRLRRLVQAARPSRRVTCQQPNTLIMTWCAEETLTLKATLERAKGRLCFQWAAECPTSHSATQSSSRAEQRESPSSRESLCWSMRTTVRLSGLCTGSIWGSAKESQYYNRCH